MPIRPRRALGTVARTTRNASGGRHGEPSLLWRLSDAVAMKRWLADFDLLAPILPSLTDENEMHHQTRTMSAITTAWRKTTAKPAYNSYAEQLRTEGEPVAGVHSFLYQFETTYEPDGLWRWSLDVCVCTRGLQHGLMELVWASCICICIVHVWYWYNLIHILSHDATCIVKCKMLQTYKWIKLAAQLSVFDRILWFQFW